MAIVTAGMPVTIYQKDINGKWNAYTNIIYVTGDIANVDGRREVTVQFSTPPETLNYTPQVNDVMVPEANDHTDYWNGRFGTPYEDGDTEAYVTGDFHAGIMFLKIIGEDGYTFAPVMCLDESSWIVNPNKKFVQVYREAIADVWNRLTAGVPGLNPVEGDYVVSDSHNFGMYDGQTGAIKLSDLTSLAFQTFTGGVIAGIQYIGGVPMMDVLDNGYTQGFPIDLRAEHVLEYTHQSREGLDVPNVLHAYQDDNSGNFADMGYFFITADGELDWNGDVNNIGGATKRVIFESCRGGDDMTPEDDARAKAATKLATSPFWLFDQWCFRLDMAGRYDIGQLQFRLGEYDYIAGVHPDPIRMKVREFDFANEQIIIGTNDDITFG